MVNWCPATQTAISDGGGDDEAAKTAFSNKMRYELVEPEGGRTPPGDFHHPAPRP